MWMYLLFAFIFLLVLGVVVFVVMKYYKPDSHHNKNIIHKNLTKGLPKHTQQSLEELEYDTKMKRKRFYESKASPLSYVYNVDGEKVECQKDKFYWL